MASDGYNSPTVTSVGHDGRFRDAAIGEIASDLQNLLCRAEAFGVVITVDLEALEPLAMRNYRMVGYVRGAR